jgi:hypothetical protein
VRRVGLAARSFREKKKRFHNRSGFASSMPFSLLALAHAAVVTAAAAVEGGLIARHLSVYVAQHNVNGSSLVPLATWLALGSASNTMYLTDT